MKKRQNQGIRGTKTLLFFSSIGPLIGKWTDGFITALKSSSPIFKRPCVRISIYRCISILITDFGTTIKSSISSLLTALWSVFVSYQSTFEEGAVFKEEENLDESENEVIVYIHCFRFLALNKKFRHYFNVFPLLFHQSIITFCLSQGFLK